MTIKEIDSALDEGQSLKQIAQAYSEIANLKIKKIRSSVERNRVFFKEISTVYALVKKIAAKKRVMLVKRKKTVSIVLTSNYRFYGRINADLLDFFVKTTSKLDTDHVYLGKTAIEHFKTQPVSKNYQEVVLKSDQPTSSELLSLVDILNQYSQVLVFYSSMKSLLIQVPTVADITAAGEAISIASHVQDTKGGDEGPQFIFEPELPKILQFFDSQILTLLLEGTFLESELSRTASRFISMDQAQSEADKFIKDYQILKAYVERSMDNNKILENFASLMAIRKDTYA